MAENKSFRESRIYPVFYMLLITAFFGIILSLFYHSTKERVRTFAELRYKSALLGLFAIPLDDVEDTFSRLVVEQETGGLKYYLVADESGVRGYCFEIVGNGLWGSITALIATDEKLERLIGIDILEQNETPGLGGRITEKDFQSQFSGKSIRDDSQVIRYRLIPESDTATEKEVNQITGATSSSQSVVDMLYRNLVEIAAIFDEHLTANTVH